MYITAFFTSSGTPVTGLTPTVDVYKVSDATHEAVAQNMSEVAGGWYKFLFLGYVEGTEYVIVADGGSALGIFERYAYGGNETFCDYIADIKAKTDNLPSGIMKNAALLNFSTFMVLSIDHVTPAIGKSIVCVLSKDGSAFGSTTNPVVEMSSGMYKIDLTQSEMNADTIVTKFTGNDCDQRVIPVYTS